MKPEEIIQYTLKTCSDTVLIESWGEKGIFYNPALVKKRGVYVLTIKEKDGANDKASNINREGVFRLNIGIEKNSFKELFGLIPTRPGAGTAVNMPFDFTQINTILPHPVYAWMAWISILNPTPETFEKIKPYIMEAYKLAQKKLK